MKRIKVVIFALILGLCALGGSILAKNVNAETVTNSLTVSPQYHPLVLVPGETYEGSIRVSSQASSTSATNFEVSVGPFSESKGEGSKDDYGAINYIDRSTYNQIVDWVKIEKPTGIVQPNETEIVPFKIVVPEDAPAGGQYASIIVKDTNPAVTQGEGVAINSVMQILSIIYAEIAGETKEDGIITNNSMPTFLLNGPLTAESMVKNNGNVHTKANYTLQVWPLFSGEEICTNEEAPEESVVLPGTERYHAQVCDNLPAVGIFKAKQTVKIFGETSIIERTIFICPLWLIFVIVFVLIMIVAWLVMRIRGRRDDD